MRKYTHYFVTKNIFFNFSPDASNLTLTYLLPPPDLELDELELLDEELLEDFDDELTDEEDLDVDELETVDDELLDRLEEDEAEGELFLEFEGFETEGDCLFDEDDELLAEDDVPDEVRRGTDGVTEFPETECALLDEDDVLETLVL